MFGHYWEVTPEFLKSIGVRAVLSDIDNTLAPYEQAEPDDRIRAWVRSLEENGIRVALVSNNHPPRVEEFNRTLGLLAFPDSGKPKKKALTRAMTALGADPRETAMLGDQLLTDTTAGNNIGLTTIVVPPINDKNNAFFRAKRWLEVSTIKKYVKLHGGDSREICKFWLEGGYKKKNRK